MTGSPAAIADAGLADFVLPAPLGLALEAARVALDHADPVCRLHWDVPPSRPGPWTGSCGMCEQPARVRRALALLRRLAGEPVPVRRYVVDATAEPDRVAGLFPVLTGAGQPIRGLRAPDDPARAAAVLVAELERRGELGPFDLLVTIKENPR
jgi:hypothetical protein